MRHLLARVEEIVGRKVTQRTMWLKGTADIVDYTNVVAKVKPELSLRAQEVVTRLIDEIRRELVIKHNAKIKFAKLTKQNEEYILDTVKLTQDKGIRFATSNSYLDMLNRLSEIRDTQIRNRVEIIKRAITLSASNYQI